MTVQIGEEQGYQLTLLGCSYQCPALRLYGYRDDLALRRAVRRELRQRAKKTAARVGAIATGEGR